MMTLDEAMARLDDLHGSHCACCRPAVRGILTDVYAAGVERARVSMRAELRRRLIDRGPHHVDCPAGDTTARSYQGECRCLVGEMLTVLFRED